MRDVRAGGASYPGAEILEQGMQILPGKTVKSKSGGQCEFSGDVE